MAVAFLGGVVLAASSVLLHEGDGYQTFPEVDSVLHSAMPGIPDDAGRTMVATYCGYELEGSPTASGQPFDPEGYTAAHRRLPLGMRLGSATVANLCGSPSTTGVLTWLVMTWISRWRRPGR